MRGTMKIEKVTLRYWRGLLVAEGDPSQLQHWFRYDSRTNNWVAEACAYRNLIEQMKSSNIEVVDQAKAYDEIKVQFAQSLRPRNEQTQALKEWLIAKGRGVVCLPTGGGKTVLAMMAMSHVNRSTLIVVPTIDLVQQWHQAIKHWLGIDAGMLGGGEKSIAPVTVSTYDSALIHSDRIGSMFGFLVVDECHHLAGPQNQLVARANLAPFRLGLSATVERSDGGESIIYDLMGPKVFTANIRTMVGAALAPYSVKRILVELTKEEREAYDEGREAYLGFIKRYRIDLGQPRGWQEFLAKASRLPGGKEALIGHRRQKSIAQKASAKFGAIWKVVHQHKGERIIIFTDDNEHAYSIGEVLIAPVITHLTKPGERKLMLESFREGHVSILVTSKVLNEGVDVPEASVAVVASGSGAVREHVQRLGRVLRSSPGKEAVLYEILAADTSEISVNRRRREHHAYEKRAAVSP